MRLSRTLAPTALPWALNSTRANSPPSSPATASTPSYTAWPMLGPEMASGEVHRTQLAHERTYLAWWRTGLAGIAAGFGVGRVLPEVVSGTNWPYIALGTALAGAGLAAMVYGIVHYRELQAALREEREPHTGEGFLLALAAVGIAVGAVSVLLVLLSP